MAENKEEKVEAEDKPIAEKANDVIPRQRRSSNVESKQSTAQNDELNKLILALLEVVLLVCMQTNQAEATAIKQKIYIYEATGQSVAFNILHHIMPPIKACKKGALHTQSSWWLTCTY